MIGVRFFRCSPYGKSTEMPSLTTGSAATRKRSLQSLFVFGEIRILSKGTAKERIAFGETAPFIADRIRTGHHERNETKGRLPARGYRFPRSRPAVCSFRSMRLLLIGAAGAVIACKRAMVAVGTVTDGSPLHLGFLILLWFFGQHLAGSKASCCNEKGSKQCQLTGDPAVRKSRANHHQHGQSQRYRAQDRAPFGPGRLLIAGSCTLPSLA